jgi:hypothetical protein
MSARKITTLSAARHETHPTVQMPAELAMDLGPIERRDASPQDWLMQDASAQAVYLQWVGRGGDAIEAIAVVLIVSYILDAALTWLTRSLLRRHFSPTIMPSFASRWDAQ